jgi:transposase-like protein
MPTRKTKLSVRKAGRLVEYFVAETTARTAADLLGVNKATAAFCVIMDETPTPLEISVEGGDT